MGQLRVHPRRPDSEPTGSRARSGAARREPGSPSTAHRRSTALGRASSAHPADCPSVIRSRMAPVLVDDHRPRRAIRQTRRLRPPNPARRPSPQSPGARRAPGPPEPPAPRPCCATHPPTQPTAPPPAEHPALPSHRHPGTAAQPTRRPSPQPRRPPNTRPCQATDTPALPRNPTRRTHGPPEPPAPGLPRIGIAHRHPRRLPESLTPPAVMTQRSVGFPGPGWLFPHSR